MAAERAWKVKPKAAGDFSSMLALIPGMPVFLTFNIATVLGLSNGSEGTVVSVKYTEQDDRRFAISAEVDFPTYTNTDLSAPYPHRVTVPTLKHSVSFKYNSTRSLTFTRNQLPLIPAFAYTAHNAQGRSLSYACIDLESARSTAAAYVMLSRLRTTAGLAILRPFSFEKISNHIREDLRKELARLDELDRETKESTKGELAWYYNLVA